MIRTSFNINGIAPCIPCWVLPTTPRWRAVTDRPSESAHLAYIGGSVHVQYGWAGPLLLSGAVDLIVVPFYEECPMYAPWSQMRQAVKALVSRYNDALYEYYQTGLHTVPGSERWEYIYLVHHRAPRLSWVYGAKSMVMDWRFNLVGLKQQPEDYRNARYGPWALDFDARHDPVPGEDFEGLIKHAERGLRLKDVSSGDRYSLEQP